MNDADTTACQWTAGRDVGDSGPPQSTLSSILALAHTAYMTRSVRLVHTEIGAYTHIVASRQGLFAVNEHSFSLIAHGLFFGITLRGSSIYLFEACDLPRHRTRRGRIIQLLLAGGRIVDSGVVAEGLDNGCHQIDFVDGRLCILDTYNQRVLRFSMDGRSADCLHPLPAGQNGDWLSGYAHINSLLQVGEKILLLLHNGAEQTGRDSVIASFDLTWQPLDRWTLPAAGCHNIAALEDGTVLCCGSLTGELISSGGLRIKISSMMTRGLSVGTDSIVVGASTFSSRRGRLLAPGTVTFVDRTFVVRSVLDIPAAPTEIRRLDGRDYSLSTHATRHAAAVIPQGASWRG